MPRFTIYRALCDHLKTLDQIMVVTECFHGMMSELGDETLDVGQAEWVLGGQSCIPCTHCCLCDGSLSDFRQHFSKRLEYLGDAAMNALKLNEALSGYSTALSLDPPAPQGLFIKRSKVYIALSLWENALNDANKVRSFVSCRFILVNSIIIR